MELVLIGAVALLTAGLTLFQTPLGGQVLPMTPICANLVGKKPVIRWTSLKNLRM